MRMTALDVQNHKFPRRMRGYDVDEVEQFRAALVEDWSSLTAEADRLRRRVAELESRLSELSTHDDALRHALITAQGVSDELRRTAEHEAQMRVGQAEHEARMRIAQAELHAERTIGEAHRQASRLAHDVRELRTLRVRMAASVRTTIETHLALLEGFTRDPEEEFDAPMEARLEALAGGRVPAEPPRPEASAEAAEETGQVVEVEIHDAPPRPSTRKLDALVIPTGSAQTAAGRRRPSAPESPGWTILPDGGRPRG